MTLPAEDDASRLRSRLPSSVASKRSRLSIYVSSKDEGVWELARIFCQRHNISLSSLVADAVARYFNIDTVESE